MKLTELFTGEKQITDNGKTQTATVKNDIISRQIRSMVPGQTIQGEVVAKNGNEVQLRVVEDIILQAKLEQSINLEVGKMMTFEVRNNGKALTLSPLFTNVAMDANVLKALDMAALPVNDTTVAIARQLMEAGMPIHRTMLQQVYREVNLFPQSQVADIVNLHKLQMPVNEANVTQIASYRNMTHQLASGLEHVLEAVPDMFSQMMESGDTEGAVKLYQQLTLFAEEGTMAEETLKPASGMVEQNVLADSDVVSDNGKTVITETGENSTTIVVNMPEQTAILGKQFTRLLQQIAKGTASPDELAQLNQMWKEMGDDKEFMKPILQQLKQQWTLTPKEVAEDGKVEELYHKINRQIRQLTQTMESLGQNSGNAYKAAVTLTQNLDFMQQINQMYAYVQLPLRLQNGEAHGELYVYSNKKHLASEDGHVSALLHLDMEYLGPVDVYVSMKQNDVKTQFYLKDDEMLDFLMAHIDILTEQLQKRGYHCDCEMQVKDANCGENDSIHKLLLQEKHVPLAEYAFDVRT